MPQERIKIFSPAIVFNFAHFFFCKNISVKSIRVGAKCLGSYMCISDGSYTRCISIVGNMFCISQSISAKLNVRETYTSCINSKQKQECTRKKVLQKTNSFLQKFVGEKKLETDFV